MTNAPNTIDILNRLVVLHHRSLATYLGYASPTWHRDDKEAKAELQRIVADQEELVDRLGEMIVENGGTVSYGSYPMEFTGYHDLSFEYLLSKLVGEQRQAVSLIDSCVQQLNGAHLAQSLAQEDLGMAKGHLESLEDLPKHPAGC